MQFKATNEYGKKLIQTQMKHEMIIAFKSDIAYNYSKHFSNCRSYSNVNIGIDHRVLWELHQKKKYVMIDVE